MDASGTGSSLAFRNVTVLMTRRICHPPILFLLALSRNASTRSSSFSTSYPFPSTSFSVYTPYTFSLASTQILYIVIRIRPIRNFRIIYNCYHTSTIWTSIVGTIGEYVTYLIEMWRICRCEGSYRGSFEDHLCCRLQHRPQSQPVVRGREWKCNMELWYQTSDQRKWG